MAGAEPVPSSALPLVEPFVASMPPTYDASDPPISKATALQLASALLAKLAQDVPTVRPLDGRIEIDVPDPHEGDNFT